MNTLDQLDQLNGQWERIATINSRLAEIARQALADRQIANLVILEALTAFEQILESDEQLSARTMAVAIETMIKCRNILEGK